MRKNNINDMTITEQIVKIREDGCKYACKYREYYEEGDEVLAKVSLQGYCHECPLMRLHIGE